MKRLLTTLFTIFFIVFTLILTLPTNVNAATKEYTIDNLDINAIILPNGDVEVNEILEYNFTGDFNGVFRNLNENGSSGININEASILDESGVNEVATEGYNEQNNTYELNQSGGYTQIKLFSKSSNENKKFNFKYTIKEAAKKYSDYSELYWNFYTVENVPSINNGKITISLKDSSFDLDKSTYELFGDGNISSTSSDTSIVIDFTDLTSLIGIDVKFQKDFLSLTNEINYVPDNNINNNEYEGTTIVTSSDNSAEAIFIFFSLFIGAGGVILLISRNKKAIEKYRSEYIFENNYLVTEPPSALPPALVNLLVNEKVVSENMINPTLFYLVNKGYYSVQERKTYTNKKGKSVQKDDLVFTRVKSNISLEYSHLDFLFSWFERYEKDGEFSLQGLKEYVKSTSKGQEFIKDLNHWKSLVRKDAERFSFFTQVGMSTIIENSWYNERDKWLKYKSYIMTLSTDTVDNIDDFISENIIYAYALEVNTNVLRNIIEIANVKSKFNRHDDFQEGHDQHFNNGYLYNSYYLNNYFYYTTLFNDINSNAHSSAHVNDASSGSIDFGGISSGSDFSGGGGGDSGAF